MTTKNSFDSRNRDMQDGTERHVHDELTYDDAAGAIIKVKGNGTEDPDVYVLRIGGIWLHLPKGTNADVFLLAGGADTTQKHALLDIPRDKHKKTKAGTTGIQHPTNPDISVEVSDKGVRVYGDNFAVGKDGDFEIKDGKGIFRKGLTVVGGIKADTIETPELTATNLKSTTAESGKSGPVDAGKIEPVEDAPAADDAAIS